MTCSPPAAVVQLSVLLLCPFFAVASSRQQLLYSDTSVSYERYQPGMYQRPSPHNMVVTQQQQGPYSGGYTSQQSMWGSAGQDIVGGTAKRSFQEGILELLPAFYDMPYFREDLSRWVCPAGSVVEAAAAAAAPTSSLTGEEEEDVAVVVESDDAALLEEELKMQQHPPADEEEEEEVPMMTLPGGIKVPLIVPVSEPVQQQPLTLPEAKELDRRLEEGSEFRDALADVTGLREVNEPIGGKKKRVQQAATFFGIRAKPQIPSAEPAFCQPELTTVPLGGGGDDSGGGGSLQGAHRGSTSSTSPTSPTPTSPSSSSSSASAGPTPSSPHSTSVFYYPSCTRIERCGGCCSHELLECQPTEVEKVSMKVVKTEFSGSTLTYAGEETVVLERHKKCTCDCRTKEQVRQAA